ncbi:MAG: V-type ATP synthase subunit F [Bacillota bacterium]
MKFYLISDNVDTLIGMRLAGISGIIAHERDAVLKAMESACADNDMGIILITELLAELVQDELKEIRLDSSKPIITIIPDRHGERRPKDYITNYIKDSIGVKI